MAYFAARSAAMGRVEPSVVAATFYNFNPDYVARFVPRCWDICPPVAVVAARYAGVDAALRRVLGSDLLISSEIAEAAELATLTARAARPDGRPIFAAHATVPWPDQPHLALWHAITLLREHRGDSHTAALVTAGLTGLEALITHVATDAGFTAEIARQRRGWSQEDWDDAVESLRERDVLGEEFTLTKNGIRLRQVVEDRTDRLALQPWHALGEDGFERFVKVAHPIYQALITQFPRAIFGSKWSVAQWPEEP